MKRLKDYLETALKGYYADDELRTVVRSLCLEGLRVDPTAFFLNEDVSLSDGQTAWLHEAVRRLQTGEPLQYVLGTALFAGLNLQVDGRVLIPRPETGELVELARALTKGQRVNKSTSQQVLERCAVERPSACRTDGAVRAERSSTSQQVNESTSQQVNEAAGRQVRILDVGTGSGCIAIALAKELREAEVTACDVSEEALEVARCNAEMAEAEVRFVRADVLDTESAARILPRNNSLIVSNPPYIRRSERTQMASRVTEWEPALALFVPDDDPLVFYRALARLGHTDVLAEGGCIAVEVNSSFAFETAALFRLWGYDDVCVKEDMYGLARFVTCRKSFVSGTGKCKDADADV